MSAPLRQLSSLAARDRLVAALATMLERAAREELARRAAPSPPPAALPSP